MEKFKTRWLFDIELLLRYESELAQKISHYEHPLLTWDEVGGSKLGFSQVRRIAYEALKILLIRLQILVKGK